MTPKRQVLEVWGELACFSQPPLKVERFSYPIITPSAARGIFDAIYWKPKFFWQVTHIELLSLPTYIALRRNEVKNKFPSEDSILRWMMGWEDPEPIWADGDEEITGSKEKGRTQRQTMALKNVHYRLHAEIRPWPEYITALPDMEGQFRRRAAHGQCVNQPYFGCREFPAYFQLAESSMQSPAVPLDMHLGWMLYDVYDLSKPGQNTDDSFISLFNARVEKGVLRVPEFASVEVRKPIRSSKNA